jgi:hypothetical protein
MWLDIWPGSRALTRPSAEIANLARSSTERVDLGEGVGFNRCHWRLAKWHKRLSLLFIVRRNARTVEINDFVTPVASITISIGLLLRQRRLGEEILLLFSFHFTKMFLMAGE